MSTRTAKDDSVFHQNRYASSPEFERGLIANLVAMRCETIDDRADRELIWFVQHLSHQPGGMAALAAELLATFADRLGTITMAKSRKANYSAEEIKKIRLELPQNLRHLFPLRGEDDGAIERISGKACVAKYPYSFRVALAEEQGNACGVDALLEREAQERGKALAHPATYPTSTILEICREAAVNGFDASDTDKLENELCCFCLDPGWNLAAGGPWYFADLVNVLREHQKQWILDNSGAHVTALGKKVCAALDYTLHSRSLVLLEGNARLGKSFSARSWCLQHPGQVRFIEIPPGNDDTSFFRALARGLGLGNFLRYKTIDIRQRVESVILSGDLVLVFDESQRLWPERNFRYAFPSRITWLMAIVNAGVPICLISTPQFIQAQKLAEKNGWNSAQLTGRIGHYEFLPLELSVADLIAVAKTLLPEASAVVLQALADYARTSSRYLAAVDSIAKRARYLAQAAGRSECSASDVRAAMKESVIPSDTMLVRTLEQAKKTPAKGRPRLQTPSLADDVEMSSRNAEFAEPEFIQRGTSLPQLIQG